LRVPPNQTTISLAMADARPQIGPGLTVGRYQILERLGTGGMGEVFLAQDTSLQRRVAIKVLSQHHLGSADLRERFAREARAVAAISHVNVVQVFDINEHDGRPYFVMEYLRGVDVAALLRSKRRLDPASAVAIGLAAALGLAEAAAAGVVHRDVKPGNLFLTDRGVVKVTDFGLAKGMSTNLGVALTVEGMTLGTPDYMAPEQGRGETVDTRADIYSLGCTLFHLLTGRPPFRAADERIAYPAVVARHIQKPPPHLDAEISPLPMGLSDLVLQMMSKDPAARPSYEATISSLQEIAADLGAAAHVSVPPPSPAPAAPPTAAAMTAETVHDLPLAPASLAPSEGAIQVPLSVPRWALLLTAVCLLLFLATGGLFLFLRPAPTRERPRSLEPSAGSGSGTGTGRAETARPVRRMVVVHIPSAGRIAVSDPVTPDEVRRHAADLAPLLRPRADVAAGLSLDGAREVVQRMGGRLPTTKEWFYIEASSDMRVLRQDCEWVDDGKTHKAKCFKGTRAVVRAVDRPYRNSLFRLDVPLDG
jgi:eukaryotic-like serine/threonine-protein kinase